MTAPPRSPRTDGHQGLGAGDAPSAEPATPARALGKTPLQRIAARRLAGW